MLRWAKDPWRQKEGMRQLRGMDGRWLESEGDKVDRLVRDLFGEEAAQASVVVGEGEEFPYSEDKVME